MFYTSKIPICFSFTRRKHVDCDIYNRKLKMEDVLLIYYEQIVSFYTQIQTNSKDIFSD